MKNLVTVLIILLIAISAFAHTHNPCCIPDGIYRTETQGGWGNNCHDGNANCIRDQYFATAFPGGLLLGDNVTPGRHWMLFTSALSVKNYLPATGTSHVLSNNYTNPSFSTEAGNFGGQLTALGMSIGMGILNPAVNPPFGDLRSLVITQGPFVGRTVGDVYGIANQILSGNTSLLSLYHVTVSIMASVLTQLNENFDDGENSNGYVVMPECNQLQSHCAMTVAAVAQELTCTSGVVAPNPFDIAVTVHNTGTITSNGVVVSLNNGTGAAGSATISPATITITALTAGQTQTVHFSATSTLNGLSGIIDFAGSVSSLDCNTYSYQVHAHVPQCQVIPSVCQPDPLVVLIPTDVPFPTEQHYSVCAKLSVVAPTQLVVPVVNPTNVPTVTITSGCPDCGDANCTPLTDWSYDSQAWIYQTDPPAFVNTISAAPNATGCCVCLHLDFILPVELNGFTAIPGDNAVTLNWTTASESGISTYEIERNGDHVYSQSATNNPTGSTYSWMDNRALNGTTYSYTLYAVSSGGTRQQLRSVNATPLATMATVNDYVLQQNYPNPFNPTTQIAFSMKDAGWMKLTVYNLIGQQMKVLWSGMTTAGYHSITFDGADLPTGVYIYKMETANFTAQQKMLLMK